MMSTPKANVTASKKSISTGMYWFSCEFSTAARYEWSRALASGLLKSTYGQSCSSNGLNTFIPKPAKSLTFLVATAQPCALAVAAIKESRT